ncbi:hypothetical protein ACSRCJ_20655 [Salmonella enterica]|uniref:hypothetical protein n=1 Tax=Salmonella enterica TaxID=28901 RepID=UPI00296CD02D|nr:hypothetical protein [Salmonella enterica]
MFNLLSKPIEASTNLFELSDLCVGLVSELIETDNEAQRLALCGRLQYCLTALNEKCFEDLPPALIERLTVDVLPPARTPAYYYADTVMINYALALTAALLSRAMSTGIEDDLTGLLHDVVCLVADELKQPRFIRTPEGIKTITGELRHG